MKKKWLVVILVSFLSVFVLFGCLPSQSEEEPEELPEEQPEEPGMLKVYLPETTPSDATIYLVGSYNVDSNNNWLFTDAATSEIKVEGEQMYAEFDILNLFDDEDYPVEYKYTYDDNWDSEEVDEEGNGLDGNRRLDVAPQSDVENVVLNWKGIELFDYTGLQQEITVNFVVQVPERTEGDVIYIAGSFVDWGFVPLNKDSDTGYYTTEATMTSYTSQAYKFFLTANDWSSGEGNADGGYIGNRIIILTDDATIENVIESWEN